MEETWMNYGCYWPISNTAGQPIELSEFLLTSFFVQLTLQSRATLNNGVEIPRLGLGVYQTPIGETTLQAVRYALKVGYRHIDTAWLYGNEGDVGRAVLESGIPREEIFVTTKVWNSDQGYDSTLRACERSIRRLGLSCIDLYLIHWPIEGMGKDTWKAMIQLLRAGKVRAIGVSNYDLFQVQEILQNFDVVPSVNQVEFHPFLFQEELLQFCNNNSIQLEAYSPLTRGNKLNHPALRGLEQKYSKTSAQILIRWSLQHNVVVIPKSTHENRIKENSQVFDFQLEEKDMKLLDSLNENFHTLFL
jgi:diketogulonate reductase-like aldo/keto reductase